MTKPVFRFAPSPNGQLHLGHAYSALLNKKMASDTGGRFLLRMEDIDTARCSPEFEQGIYEDLRWLGLDWEQSVRRQSEHFPEYRNALTKLADKGLVYPAFLSESEIRERIGQARATGKEWPSDPNGNPLYPQRERNLTEEQQLDRMAAGASYTWRLDMKKAIAAAAPLSWNESGCGPDGETGTIIANPAIWGDVIIARMDTPTSYHLSVVVDDALQQITHVVRGHDLFHATSVHRLLQKLLDLPEPRYHHHDLILADDGLKLSKSRHDTALRSLREQGLSADDIQAKIGL